MTNSEAAAEFKNCKKWKSVSSIEAFNTIYRKVMGLKSLHHIRLFFSRDILTIGLLVELEVYSLNSFCFPCIFSSTLPCFFQHSSIPSPWPNLLLVAVFSSFCTRLSNAVSCFCLPDLSSCLNFFLPCMHLPSLITFYAMGSTSCHWLTWWCIWRVIVGYVRSEQQAGSASSGKQVVQ